MPPLYSSHKGSDAGEPDLYTEDRGMLRVTRRGPIARPPSQYDVS